MKNWSRSDSLTTIGIGVAILGLVAALATPESRRFLGLDPGGYDLLGKVFHYSFSSSESRKLLGTWRFKGNDESGQPIKGLYHLRPDSSSCYEYHQLNRYPNPSSEDATWQYKGDEIFEKFRDGSHIRETSIKWIDDNRIEATNIDDNMYPQLRGAKLEYYRVQDKTDLSISLSVGSKALNPL